MSRLQRAVAQKRRCFRNNLTGILKGDKKKQGQNRGTEKSKFVGFGDDFEILNGCYQTVLNACL